MSKVSLLETIPDTVFPCADQLVTHVLIGFHCAGKPMCRTAPNDIYKATDLLESFRGRFRGAVIVLTSGDELCFDMERFLKIRHSRPSKPKPIVEAPYTELDTVTGIYDLTCPIERYPTVPLSEGYFDEEGCLIQSDRGRHIYRNGVISYRIEKTDSGYYLDLETDVGWLKNLSRSYYEQEASAHREALWISRGQPLFYRPIKLQVI